MGAGAGAVEEGADDGAGAGAGVAAGIAVDGAAGDAAGACAAGFAAGAFGSTRSPFEPHAAMNAAPAAVAASVRSRATIVGFIPPSLANMTETEFITIADRALALIGEALDASDADLDWQLQDGILEIDCGAGGKIIVNRHVPNREMWLAARGGGFHYRPAPDGWHDTRSGGDLRAALAAALRAQTGEDVELPALPTLPAG